MTKPLDAIDAALIATARSSIDLASYALTDPIVIGALNDADHRGVVVRIVLDPRERHDFVKLGDLSDNVRIKCGGPFMHLKAYAIDGERLRTGVANHHDGELSPPMMKGAYGSVSGRVPVRETSSERSLLVWRSHPFHGNFSTSGENAQDNDLVVIYDAGAVAKLEAHFERMWDAAQPMIEFGPAINALEPK